MRYVIIGNSAAGIGAAEGIRQIDKQGEITVITNEPHHTYSRPLISYLLLGKVTQEKMKYRGDAFYTENNIDLIIADAAQIDVRAKHVVLSNGKRIPYDKLLVATGSSPFVPPFEDLDTVENKYTFMRMDDALRLSRALDITLDETPDTAFDNDKRVLIIGAGLIGLKCAEGILDRTASITVLDLAPRILSSILDDDGAKLVQEHLEQKEIKFKLSESVKRFDRNTAMLESGEKLEFDILVLAVGVRPNTALLKDIAMIDRGIAINGKSETTVPDIYAAGDCTQTHDVSSGQDRIMALLPNAYMQGESAGINMAGGEGSFDKAIPMNAIGFFGLHIITAGNYSGDVYCGEVCNEGAKNGDACSGLVNNKNYKRLFYSDNKLNGYILIGNVEKAGIYTSLIRERTPLDTIDFALICEKPGLMAFTKEDRKIKLGGEVK